MGGHGLMATFDPHVCPDQSDPLAESCIKVDAFMEIAHAAPRKRTLTNWKAQDWIEHASFGLGQVSESREDKLDIEFVSGGRKTILKSTELKAAAPPIPAFKVPKVKSQTTRIKAESLTRPPL
jgi:hypothetical protein